MTIDPPISNAQIYVSVDILFLMTPLTIEMTMHKHFLVVTPSRDDETGRVRSIPTELFLNKASYTKYTTGSDTRSDEYI